MSRLPFNLALRTYRLLLHLYPAHFRMEYGEEIAQLFRDLCRDVFQEKGVHGVLSLWLLSIFDLIKSCVEEWMTTTNWRRFGVRSSVFLTGLMALGISWYVVYGIMIVATSLYLVPWDVSIVRPTEGTLAKAVNDFFEVPPGSVLPAWILLVVSIGLFLRAWRKKGFVSELPWRFALLNVLFIFAQVAVLGGGILLNNLLIPFPVNAPDEGFHRSIFPLLLEAVAIFFYIKAQIHVEIPNLLRLRIRN
jgi:hypothetical protein